MQPKIWPFCYVVGTRTSRHSDSWEITINCLQYNVVSYRGRSVDLSRPCTGGADGFSCRICRDERSS